MPLVRLARSVAVSMILAGAVAATQVTAWAAAPAAPLPMPEMAVSRALTPPTIDGKLSPGEWDRAPACTGFIRAFEGGLSNVQSVARVTYDDKYIYVAIRNYRDAKLTLLSKKGRRVDDDGIVFDPSNEVWLSPPGLPAATYQTLFNSYPAVLDAKVIPSLGYTSRAWSGKWQIASSEDKDGWTVEARAEIKAFGKDKIEDGSTWKALFTADVFQDGNAFRAWAPGGGFGDISRYGSLHFRDNSPVFQFLDMESLFTGKVHFPMAVTGPAKGTAEVTVTVRFGATLEDGPDDVVLQKKLSVRDGKQETFSLDTDLENAKLPTQAFAIDPKSKEKQDCKHGFCRVMAETADHQVLYQQVFPFVINGYLRQAPAKIVENPYETPFGLEAFYAPLSKKLLVKIDRYYLPGRDTVTTGKVRLVNPANNQVVAERNLAAFREDYAEFPMDLAKLDVPVETEADFLKAKPALEENKKIEAENRKRKAAGQPELPLQEVPGVKPAEYRLEAVLTRADGAEAAKAAIPVKLMGYQFEWLGNSVGISDKVIPPWTPIAWSGRSASMWNKRYELNGLGLADTIANASAPQLSGPMKLVAVIDGKEVELKADAPKATRTTEAELDLSGTASAPGLQVRTQTRVEFDGFVLNTMTVEPTQAKVEKLSLVVTMPASEAPCFVTTSGLWVSYHGWTPEKWDSRESSLTSLVGNFVPYMLLTDSERGFCWFADNEKGWILDPEAPTQELRKEGDKVVMKVNFITKAGPIAAPTTMRYGWMVTPQKPQPKGWRMTFISSGKPSPEATSVHWCDADWAVLWPYYCSPFPWHYDKSKAILQNAIGRGYVPCVGNIAHSIGRYLDDKGRNFNPVAADWGSNPGHIGNSDVARGRGPNDFQLWHFDKWSKLSGLTGLYFDENYMGEDWNYLTGGAYLLPDERVQPGYSYLGLREYDKRLRYMFHENGKPTPNLWLHTTSGQAVYAWMPDVSMEGENVEPDGQQDDYIDALPASRIRAIGMGRNLGCAPTVMCQVQRHWKPGFSEFLVRQFLGWLLLHDTLPESVEFWMPLAVEMQMWRDDMKFVPYWKPGQGVSCATKDVLVSAHVTPDRTVLWIMNTAKEDRTAEVKVDLAALGMAAGRTVTAVDAETGEPVQLANGTLRVETPKRTWRAVRLIASPALKDRQTFVAHFDQSADADAAIGSIHPRSAGELVEGKAGKGLSLDKPAAFETRLHVMRQAGTVNWQLSFDPAQAGGTLVSLGEMRVAISKGQLTLTNPKPKAAGAEAKASAAAAAAAPAAAAPTPIKGSLDAAGGKQWHAVSLSWKGQDVKLTVDGKEVLSGTLESPVPVQAPSRGMEIQASRLRTLPAGISFGPMRGAVLDDLIMEH